MSDSKDGGEQKSYLLVDVLNMAYRWFHALPPLSSMKAGIQTHVIFGWVNFLIEHKKKLPFIPKDAELIAFFDSGGTQAGQSLVTDYKGQREERPESMTDQIPFLPLATRLLGMKYVIEEGREADHLIGHFALNNKAKEKPDLVYILTSDKDMLQLVDDVTFTVKPENGGTYKKMDRQAVYDRWKVWPETIPELLLCMGDKSDNIPNVPGVGEKTAQQLLTQYGTVDNILANLDRLRPKIAESFDSCRHQLSCARELVRFTEGPLRIRQKPMDLDKIMSLCRELEMSQTLGKLMNEYS